MEENQGTCEPTTSYDPTTGTTTTTDTTGTTTTTDTTCTSGETLPSKVSGWSKLRKFLSYEITVELTPYQEKVFQEVGDFWRQEITLKSFKEFWLQDI